jgi:hypothetical protein
MFAITTPATGTIGAAEELKAGADSAPRPRQHVGVHLFGISFARIVLRLG